MGLSIVRIVASKGVSSSYSGFSFIRDLLARASSVDQSTDDIDRDTPFYELFNHSDCDGELGEEECLALLDDFKMYRNSISSEVAQIESDENDMRTFYGDWLIDFQVMLKEVVAGQVDSLRFQ